VKTSKSKPCRKADESKEGSGLSDAYMQLTVPADLLAQAQQKASSLDVDNCRKVRDLVPDEGGSNSRLCRAVHNWLKIQPKVKGMLGGQRAYPNSPVFVVACKTKKRGQHPYTKGPLHRDQDYEGPGYLSALLFLSKVTKTNGCVHLWRGTESTAMDAHNPLRCVEGRKFNVLKGLAGKLFLFDSRLLHQSMPNLSDETRITYQWLIHTSGVLRPNVEY
jgi:hypothetical protein